MSKKLLRCISVSVTSDTEDAVCEMMLQLFGTYPAVFTDLEAGTIQAQVYAELTSGQSTEKRRQLRAGLKRLAGFGLNTSGATITIRQLKAQDWAESWKRHFKAIEIGDRLLIKPSWSRRKPRAGAQVIILDPGLSFGTGQHPTTRFCLEQLVQAHQADTNQSFLDIGTGSGILAIAAEKLGFSPVAAFDFDPDAVRTAKANALLNHVHRARIARKDLTRLPTNRVEPYDVICANLTHDLLIAECAKIKSLLKRDGWLLLAGILETQFPQVVRTYRKDGLKCLTQSTAGEWTSGVFRFDDRAIAQ